MLIFSTFRGRGIKKITTPSFYADEEAAPMGKSWDTVTDNEETVMDDFTGQPIVDLIAD